MKQIKQRPFLGSGLQTTTDYVGMVFSVRFAKEQRNSVFLCGLCVYVCLCGYMSINRNSCDYESLESL
jgi:hypothetical protein